MGRVSSRLSELNLSLPPPREAAGSYVPARIGGHFLYIAGQVPFRDGRRVYLGKLGRDFSVEEGKEAARLCALNVLAQAERALDGDLDRIVACLRLGGFVNATADFREHTAVIDGGSDLLVNVLGPCGRHARTAVGSPSLPNDVAVEIDAVFEID